MDINGWLTVITVFTAIFALLPKEDLFLRFLSTSRFERYLFVIINIALIPYLLFFEKIVQRWSCFGKYTFSWGFDPENIAFVLFYTSFLWLLFRLFAKPNNNNFNDKILRYYKDLLYEKPFDDFFKLFTKYTTAQHIADNWEYYKTIFLQPVFLKNIIERKPAYLLQFWEKFNSENDFQSIFRLFLENRNSAYYAEIKEHWNSYSLLNDKPFLNTVIKDNLQQSIDNGILMVFTDHVSNHLQAEYGKASIYNQEHYHPRISEDEGFDLPVYYHIRFIGLMYSSAIKNRIDISAISHKYTNMQTIYSGMVEQMINNIIVVEEKTNQEYPTNYHWLISEIFNLQRHWLTSFGDIHYEEERYFDTDSSYVSFIPFSISLCLSELYKGLNNRKITIEFLNRIIYYNILSHYFKGLNDTLKASIEENVIKGFPNELLREILDFALNEKFAINFNDLINENFGLINNAEREILLRLLNFFKRQE